MSRYRQLSADERAAIKLAASQRVEAVWACLGVLCPDMALAAKKVDPVQMLLTRSITAVRLLGAIRGETIKRKRV